MYIRSVEVDHAACVARLLRHNGITYNYESQDALLCRARAKSLTHFYLDTKCDVWLTIDGDILFDDDAALEICQQAMTHDVVVGQYVTRSRDHCKPTSLQLDNTTIEYAGDSTPQPIKWGATGFMAIHRRVVEKLIKRPDVHLCHNTEPWRFYSNIFTPYDIPSPWNEGDYIYLSEDYAACDRAAQEGFTIYVNPSVRLLHKGEYAFRLEDSVFPPPEQMAMSFTRGSDGKYKIESYG